MSAAFQDLWNELMGQVKHLDQFSAAKFVNRAYRDISDTREWGYLRATGVLQAPTAISSGTVSVTQFSNEITASGASKTALDSAGIPLLGSRQIRIGSSLPYQISEYDDSTGIITLDRAYQGDTDALATYSVIRCYYSLASDFIRFISVVDFVNSCTLYYGPKWTQQLLNQIDPQRTNTVGPPLCLATWIPDSEGTPQFEMWPYPTTQRTYTCEYRKQGADLDDGDEFPPILPAQLILARAKYRAYEYAEANKGNQVSLQKTNWITLMAACEREYQDQLMRAQKQDREAYPDNLIIKQRRSVWDANWIQAHVPGWTF